MALMDLDRVVVVGASLAGLRAAEALRSEGFTGAITVVGGEPHLPYDRPPLSKQVLTGAWEPDRVILRKPDDMGSIDVEWRLGVPGGALDVGEREVVLTSDERIGFDALVIATGAAPRRLPEAATAELTEAGPSVVTLRTIDESIALRELLATGDRRVVVIGAGFIGLEVAAAARTRGNEVVVLEGAPAPLIRGLGAEMGRAVTACHGDHGVDIRCGVTVDSIADAGVMVRGESAGESSGDVVTEVVPADVVVVGIGVQPCTGWLEGSGLTIDNGVVCDETLLAAGGIYAAGDVARWENRLFGEQMRIEHWTNAAEQGAAAARNLLAVAAGETAEPFAPVPFFWSDQFDRRIQFLGHAGPDDQVEIVAGSVEERSFLALYGRQGRLRGALGLNCPRLVMPYRQMLAAGATWDEALVRAAG